MRAVSDIDVGSTTSITPPVQRPETRRALILVTHHDLPDNTRAAQARIEAIAARLAREPGRFE
jgi:hypothetical protein